MIPKKLGPDVIRAGYRFSEKIMLQKTGGLRLMAKGDLDPVVTARLLEDGSAWFVEVVWPDGSIDRVGDFGLESTARDWIAHEFRTYFKDRFA